MAVPDRTSNAPWRFQFSESCSPRILGTDQPVCMYRYMLSGHTVRTGTYSSFLPQQQPEFCNIHDPWLLALAFPAPKALMELKKNPKILQVATLPPSAAAVPLPCCFPPPPYFQHSLGCASTTVAVAEVQTPWITTHCRFCGANLTTVQGGKSHRLRARTLSLIEGSNGNSSVEIFGNLCSSLSGEQARPAAVPRFCLPVGLNSSLCFPATSRFVLAQHSYC